MAYSEKHYSVFMDEMHAETIVSQFRAKAKFDFIKIRLPASLNTFSLCLAFEKAIKGRIETSRSWRDCRDDQITIHDPAITDLQWLLDNYPEAEVLGIELTVDFFLLDGSNDPKLLKGMYDVLNHGLNPWRHPCMTGSKRKRFNDQTGKILPDTLNTRSTGTTMYWQNPKAQTEVKLYRKTVDNNQPVDEQSVRIETRQTRGGCQGAGLYRVAELPFFAGNMRRELSRFFHVAKGIKPKTKRTRTNDPQKATNAAHAAQKESDRVARAWSKYGAAWAAKHGYDVVPNTTLNRMIGDALRNFRDDLNTLKLTRKVDQHPGYDVLATLENTGNLTQQNLDPIEALLSSPSLSSSNTASPVTAFITPVTSDANPVQGEGEARAADEEGNNQPNTATSPNGSTLQPSDADDRAAGDAGESSANPVLSVPVQSVSLQDTFFNYHFFSATLNFYPAQAP